MPEDMPVTKCINVMVGITRSKVFLLLLCVYRFLAFLASLLVCVSVSSASLASLLFDYCLFFVPRSERILSHLCHYVQRQQQHQQQQQQQQHQQQQQQQQRQQKTAAAATTTHSSSSSNNNKNDTNYFISSDPHYVASFSHLFWYIF